MLRECVALMLRRRHDIHALVHARAEFPDLKVETQTGNFSIHEV